MVRPIHIEHKLTNELQLEPESLLWIARAHARIAKIENKTTTTIQFIVFNLKAEAYEQSE